MAHTIKYNDYTIPDRIDGIRVDGDANRTTVTVQFVLSAADANALTAADAAMRAALLAPYKNLEVDFGDTDPEDDWLRLQQTANTGMNAMPSLQKVGDDFDGEVARGYIWTCTFELPGHQTGFRRSGEYRDTLDADRRRTLVFTAVYTAGVDAQDQPVGARANALENGPTWAEGIKNGIDNANPFDLVGPDTVTVDQNDKVATWTRTYKEQTEKDDASGQHEAVIDAVLDYRLEMPQRYGVLRGGSGSNEGSVLPGEIKRSVGFLNRVNCSYRATIDKTKITSDGFVENLWRTTLRPWLLSHMADVLNLKERTETKGSVYAETESFAFSRSTNTLQAQFVLNVPGSNSEIIRVTDRRKRTRQEGKVFRKLWDGKPNTYARWQIGAEEFLQQIVAITRAGNEPATPALVGGNYDLISEEIDDHAEEVGIPASKRGTQTSTIIEYTKVWVRSYRLVERSSWDTGQPPTTDQRAGNTSQTKGQTDSTTVTVDSSGNVTVVEGKG